MKRLLFLFILCFPFVLLSQNVNNFETEPICWDDGNGTKTSLTRVYFLSDRHAQFRKLLYTVDANFNIVTLSGGTITLGWCDCCSGGAGGETLSPWKTILGENTNDATVYIQRTGDVSIGVNENTHTLRMDGDFQFRFPNTTGIFDWRTTEVNGWDKTGMLFQDIGELNAFPAIGRNTFGFAANNPNIVDRILLGSILFGGTNPDGGLVTSAGITSAASGDWASNSFPSLLNFWITKDGQSFPTNVFTLQADGRVELDEYVNFNDGLPTSLLWFEQTDKDIFKTIISGSPSPGDVIKVDGLGTGLEWGEASGSVNTTIIRPENFGAVADFRRDIAVYVAGDNTVICMTCNFTTEDVGDYVALKFATTNSNYSNRRIALNTTIASVINSNTVELADTPTESGTHTMNWGKNNFQAFLNMFEYCVDNNIRTISFSGGTYGISAKDIVFSIANKNQVGSIKGIVQRGSLTILGNGSTIKDMWEDQQLTDEANEVSYSVLLLAEDGERRFFNFSIESPDRTHTKDYDTNTTGLRTVEDSPLIKLFGDGFNVTSGAGGHRDGFANAVYSSTGGNYNTTTKEIEDYFIIDLQNCKLEADNTIVTRFSDNPANVVRLINVEQKGGIAVAGKTIPSGFSINSGSSTLTIDAAADTLSFYDFRGLVGNLVIIGGSFTATVSSIIDGHTLELSASSGSTLSNASFEYTTGTGSSNKFGHGNYIHPNVSLHFENIRNDYLGSSQGFMLHYFSSSSVPGRTRFFKFIDVKGKHLDGNEMILDLNSPNLNLSSLDSLDFTLKNCAFRLNAGFTPKMKIENCNLQGEMAFYNDVNISNSKGNIRTLGTGNTYTLLNHDGNIDFEDGTGSLFTNNCRGELTLENGVNILRWVGGNLQSIRFPNIASSITDGLVLNTYSNPDDLGVNQFLQTNNIDDVLELKKRFKFRNLEIPSKDIRAWSSQFIQGILPLLNVEDSEEITALRNVVETPVFQIQTNYSINYNHLVLPYNANTFNVAINGYADVVWINEQGNTNIFKEFAISTAAMAGNLTIKPTGNTFELRVGGNIRLKNTGVRTQSSRFRLIPESLIFEELDINRYTSNTKPTRTTAVNNEIVYNENQTVAFTGWQYKIETTSVAGESFTPPSTTLPYVFTLANIPYRKEREQTFINPNFEITIPRTGGNDILTLGVWGELYNQNGTNVGSLNINTGEVTIRTLSTGVLTLADITVDYEYISSESWQDLINPSSYLNGDGSPFGSVTPDYIGQRYLDTNASPKIWYQSTGTSNTDWQAL
jgi:hypothetical protein